MTDNYEGPGRCALVDNPPPPLTDQGLAVGICISVGLAQFLTRIIMSDHEEFDVTSEDHIHLLDEFNTLKEEIVEEVEPIIIMKSLSEVLGELFEGDENAEEKSPTQEGAAP